MEVGHGDGASQVYFSSLLCLRGRTNQHRIISYIPYQGHTLEIDIYAGHLQGLMVLECELPDEEAAKKFVLPDWAIGAIDVTDDKRYKNKRLALASTTPE